MRRIIASEYLSLDGVFENPAWTMPYWSDQVADFQAEQTTAADTILLGRVTYDGMSQAWPQSSDEGADYFNSVEKQVVSSTLTDLAWNNSHVLDPSDLVAAITELKSREGGDILIYGSGMLVRSLLAQGLVDELRLLVHPVTVGSGARLFGADELTLGLVSARPLDTGVVVLSHARA